jgi:demethylmenaquinone methyltransferase/2-methoxy-6-polyprenyl-1,4-benzoquinol methylase
MLDIARVKQARHAQFSSIRYEQGDAMALAVESSSVDIVSIAFGLRNVSDPVQALAEFRRVLRPGGRLVVLEFDEPTNAIIRAANRLYTHHIMPWTASLLARDTSGAYRYLPRSVETFLSRDRLRDAMLAAGFSHVEQTPLTFGTCVLSCGRVTTSA